VDTFHYKNINFILWDIGGRHNILCRHYYHGTDALIFVVDSSDRERIDEAKFQIWSFLEKDEIKPCPMLILANKQDLPNAMSISEMTEKLNLHVIRGRSWYIQATSATQHRDDLYEGLDWLSNILTQSAASDSVVKPINETKEAGKSYLSSLYSTLISYLK
jgi:GTPase SAR1 family protein